MKGNFLCLVIFIGSVMPIGQRIIAAEAPKATSQAPAKIEISDEEAKAIALKLVPGKVNEVEKEKHNGDKVYSVEITSASGVRHEVLINPATGAVIEDKKKMIHDDDDGDEGEDND